MSFSFCFYLLGPEFRTHSQNYFCQKTGLSRNNSNKKTSITTIRRTNGGNQLWLYDLLQSSRSSFEIIRIRYCTNLFRKDYWPKYLNLKISKSENVRKMLKQQQHHVPTSTTTTPIILAL